MKKIALIVLILALAGAGGWYAYSDAKTPTAQYRFVKVETGDLESIVSSTGTLNAVSMVQVGTQVSGTISKIFVDFNQKVHEGDLIALIDTTFLAASVRDSDSNYERARSQLDHAAREQCRIKILFDKKMASASDYEQAQYTLDQSKTGLKSAQAALDRARINLRYASIYAPIDGTVISRPVDAGQTVAASFSAPTLFLIANDLRQMQILANVDEGDIGQIKEDLKVRFTVQTHPGRTFQGQVSQVRLQPSTIQNVVNYTVVVSVTNEDGLLLPGMTTTVDFLIERAQDVLKVPNAALRFRPTPEMMAEFRKQMERQGSEGGLAWGQGREGAPGDSTRSANRAEGGGEQREGNRGEGGGGEQGGNNRGGGGGGGGFRGGEGGNRSRDSSRLWCLDENGKLKVIRVRTGLTDGQMTEIKTKELTAGQEVISGLLTTDAPKAATGLFPGTAPAAPPGGGGGGRRGGGSPF
ncbi:MAG: efflux RND transporter periplasmic adaptor subunit [Candidatus Latescibacteria bacterium]|nr:efflux RND transporter periplasmic adaptor subunit [Candidatus Latescibacterota bacterium]